MRPSVALVATTTADEAPALLVARLTHLLTAGWDARLLCKGGRWRRVPASADPAVVARIEVAPDARGNAAPFDRRLRELSPDLVHFHSGWAAWKSLQRVPLPETRIMISFRDDGQDLGVPDPPWLCQQADLLVFGHRAGLERAMARGWPRERAEVLHRPIPEAPPATANGNRTGTGPGVLRVLSAGTLIWEQGLEHSVHAVSLLRDAGIDCRYVIVGEGDHLHAVAFARHQLGLTDCLEIVPPEGGERVAQELVNADVFLDPAVSDTTSPAALSAALSRGVPFVATHRSGLSETGGMMVARRDPRAIARALEQLAGDPALRGRLGEAGRRAAGVDDHLTRLEQLYRRTLARAE